MELAHRKALISQAVHGLRIPECIILLRETLIQAMAIGAAGDKEVALELWGEVKADVDKELLEACRAPRTNC